MDNSQVIKSLLVSASPSLVFRLRVSTCVITRSVEYSVHRRSLLLNAWKPDTNS